MQEKTPELSTDQKDRLWNLGLHEDTLFHNRSNFFLIFQGLLFASFSSIVVNNATIANLLVIAGVATSALWIYVSWYQITGIIQRIKEWEDKALPELRLVKRKPKNKTRLTPNNVMGYCIPTWLAILWVMVWCFS